MGVKNIVVVYFSIIFVSRICFQVQSVLFPNQIVQSSDAPFMVYVRNKQHYCGGVILSERIVLTAAHCLSNKGMVVHAGRSNRLYDENVQTVLAQRTLPHSNYLLDPNGIQAYNDVGLILLDTPLTFNKNVQSIEWSNDVDFKKETILYGWGSTDAFLNTPSFYLRSKNITLIPDSLCIEMLRQAKTQCNKQIYELCAYKSACNGDSGSPIVQKVGNKTKLIGITSWLADDNINCDTSPAVFELVGYFSQWIKDGMKVLMKPNVQSNYLPSNRRINTTIETNVRNVTKNDDQNKLLTDEELNLIR